MALGLCVCLVGYLLGSIPTAVMVSHRFYHVDIRTLGDGNPGARNVTRNLGLKAGLLVALADGLKGCLAVLLARSFELGLGWQAAVGFAAVLGHDFSIFLRFQGGEGFATACGTLVAIMPIPTFWGLATYGALYLVTRQPDISASVGMALQAFILWLTGQPILLMMYFVAVMVSVPIKKVLRLAIQRQAKIEVVRKSTKPPL